LRLKHYAKFTCPRQQTRRLELRELPPQVRQYWVAVVKRLQLLPDGKKNLGLPSSAKLRDESGEDRAFHETKIATARFFAERELVSAGSFRRKVEAGAGSVMALPVDAF